MENRKKFVSVLLFLLVCLLISATATFSQQSAGQLFEKALYAEEVEGELQQAIDIYQLILKENPENRLVAARSLLHLGMCYEKLGMKQSLAFYQDVIDKYPDQENEVKLAEGRITYLNAYAADLERKAKEYLKKGNEFFNRWEYESAINEYENAIKLNANSLLAMNAQYCIGQSWYRAGNYDRALETFQKLIEENPGSNIAPVTELMIAQVEHAMEQKSPSENGTQILDADTVVDSETGIEYRKIQKFTGNSDVIRWVPSTQLSPNGKFLLVDETIVPMDGTPPFIFTDLDAGNSKWSPDCKSIAFISGDSSIYTVSISPESGKLNGKEKKLFSADCDINGFNWSPDSEILYLSLLEESKNDYPEIYALKVSNRTIRKVSNESMPLVVPGCSPDGLVLACTSTFADLWLCPVNGGKAKQISDGNSVKYTAPNWTPDGKWIYSDETRKGWGRSLNFIQVENENEVELTPPEKVGTFLSFSPDEKRLFFYRPSYRFFWGMKIASTSGGPSYEPSPHLPVYGAQWSTNSKMVIVQGERNNNMEEGDAAIRIVPISGAESFLLNMEVNLDGKPFAYCVTPDQKRILFVTKKDGDVIDDFYMAPISIEKARVIGPPTRIIENWNRGGAYNTKMSMSNDGTKLAIINNENIWIYNLDNKILKQITNTSEKKKWITWSPDGSKISYQYFQDQPKFKIGSCIISSTNGKQIKRIEDYLLSSNSWSPDSKSIVYEREGKIVNHILATDKIEVVAEPKSLGYSQIGQYFWSPDGKYMLFDVRKENKVDKYYLYKYSLESGELTEIASGDTNFKYDISWSPDGKWICYCYFKSEKYLPEGTLWEADFGEVKEKLLEQD